jgi:predicted lipoprotein with Yx(FWY)xxD motif
MLRARLARTLAVAGFVGVFAVASSGAAAAPQATAAGAAKIKVSSTLAGSVITNARGYVLFMFPKEGHSIAFCVKRKSCLTDWPAVTTTGKPVAGPGVDPKLLGTIPYKGKLREVTYAGWPLHTYKFAYSVESSVMNIGIKQFGGPWYTLAPTGKIVK